MSSVTSWLLASEANHSVIPAQKLPAPTSDGHQVGGVEPRHRGRPSARISAESRSKSVA